MRFAFPLFFLLALASPLAAQARVVAAGDPVVRGDLIQPAHVTRTMSVSRGGKTFPGATIDDEITVVGSGASARLLRVQAIRTPGGTITDTALSSRGTLQPVLHRSQQPTRALAFDFAGAHVTGHVTPKDSAAVPVAQDFEAATFDSNIYDLVIAALPLAQGYEARVPFYIYERGGLTWSDVKVLRAEPVDRGGTQASAWVVSATVGGAPQTLWVDQADRAVLKVVVEPAPGVTMTMVRGS